MPDSILNLFQNHNDYYSNKKKSITGYFIVIFLNLYICAALMPADCYCSELNAGEKKTYGTYKNLKSKDIVLTVMQGNAYVMVSPTRWEKALTGLKLMAGDKLKINESTIAVINFYNEFDMKIPQAGITTIEPAGLTQLIDGALFQTTYKDGAYISEVVKEPSKAAQYRLKGQMPKRENALSYVKNKYSIKEEAFRRAASEKETDEGNYLRARVAQAKNFGNGFSLNYNESKNKISNDKNIGYLTCEIERLEREITAERTVSENLKVVIAQKKNGGSDTSSEERQLNQINLKMRELTQKSDITGSEIKRLRENQNKLNFDSQKKEW